MALASRTLTLTPTEAIISGGAEPKVFTFKSPATSKAVYSERAVAVLGRMAQVLPAEIKPAQIAVTIKCDEFIHLSRNYGFQIRWPKWEGRKPAPNPNAVEEDPTADWDYHFGAPVVHPTAEPEEVPFCPF